ncbi:hypothetical protein [Sandarakinorhabdus sp.]|uniref:hypothetical protein n=1 Tax=Sandarakinorhabdus sp. TaxID=1916663 RepID=UPI00286D9F5C|nr:hypothetical protein [Sandarakinorhabdus sp.]
MTMGMNGDAFPANVAQIPDGSGYRHGAQALAFVGLACLFIDVSAGLAFLGASGMVALIGQIIGYLHILERRLIALHRKP